MTCIWRMVLVSVRGGFCVFVVLFLRRWSCFLYCLIVLGTVEVDLFWRMISLFGQYLLNVITALWFVAQLWSCFLCWYLGLPQWLRALVFCIWCMYRVWVCSICSHVLV